MSRYYLDTGVLVWNGNGTVGKDLIQKFFEGLPPTEHTLTSLDSQPVLGKYLLCIVEPQRLELCQELAVLQSLGTNADCLPTVCKIPLLMITQSAVFQFPLQQYSNISNNMAFYLFLISYAIRKCFIKCKKGIC